MLKTVRKLDKIVNINVLCKQFLYHKAQNYPGWVDMPLKSMNQSFYKNEIYM